MSKKAVFYALLTIVCLGGLAIAIKLESKENPKQQYGSITLPPGDTLNLPNVSDTAMSGTLTWPTNKEDSVVWQHHGFVMPGGGAAVEEGWVTRQMERYFLVSYRVDDIQTGESDYGNALIHGIIFPRKKDLDNSIFGILEKKRECYNKLIVLNIFEFRDQYDFEIYREGDETGEKPVRVKKDCCNPPKWYNSLDNGYGDDNRHYFDGPLIGLDTFPHSMLGSGIGELPYYGTGIVLTPGTVDTAFLNNIRKRDLQYPLLDAFGRPVKMVNWDTLTNGGVTTDSIYLKMPTHILAAPPPKNSVYLSRGGGGPELMDSVRWQYFDSVKTSHIIKK